MLAAAISASADERMTGDRMRQRFGTFRGVAIVSRREFLELLDRLVNDPNIIRA